MNNHEILQAYIDASVLNGDFLSASVVEYGNPQYNGVCKVYTNTGAIVYQVFARDVNGNYTRTTVPNYGGDNDGVTTLSPADFLRRFTIQERIAIRAAKATDPVLNDADAMLSIVTSVRIDFADTIYYVNYLESEGYLAAGRAAEILA